MDKKLPGSQPLPVVMHRQLTRALLADDYGVTWWVPDGHLISPVTNRANYIHWLEDLLELCPGGLTPRPAPNSARTEHLVLPQCFVSASCSVRCRRKAKKELSCAKMLREFCTGRALQPKSTTQQTKSLPSLQMNSL